MSNNHGDGRGRSEGACRTYSVDGNENGKLLVKLVSTCICTANWRELLVGWFGSIVFSIATLGWIGVDVDLLTRLPQLP
jgi:hypothetical protein